MSDLKKAVLIDGVSEKEYDLPCILAQHLTPNRMISDDKRPVGDVKSIGCGAYHSLVP